MSPDSFGISFLKVARRGLPFTENIFVSGCANVKSNCECRWKNPLMILHMQKKKKKKQETLQEPYFLLLGSETVSGSLETNFSGKITLNSYEDPPP